MIVKDINKVFAIDLFPREYVCLRRGNFDLSDSLRSGRPIEFDEAELTTYLQEINRQSSRELAENGL